MDEVEIRDRIEMLKQDHRVGRAFTELVDEAGDAIAQEVVAEIHDEVVVAEEVGRDEHAVRESERRILRDIRDFDTKL